MNSTKQVTVLSVIHDSPHLLYSLNTSDHLSHIKEELKTKQKQKDYLSQFLRQLG